MNNSKSLKFNEESFKQLLMENSEFRYQRVKDLEKILLLQEQIGNLKLQLLNNRPVMKIRKGGAV